MNTIKEYNGYFTFRTIAAEEQDAVRSLIAAEGLTLDIGANHLEFSFAGRDLSDCIPRCFKRVASVLREADGELRCEIDDDEANDPAFRFFTIKDSRLWIQCGEVVRSSIVEADD